MWSDTHRYYTHHLDDSPIFPHPSNYTNLDHFLHDIRMAIRDEKQFRRHNNLLTSDSRYEFHLERQADFYFDVI